MKKILPFIFFASPIFLLAQTNIQLVKSFTGGVSSNIVVLNNKIIFQGRSSAEGKELWESDGTTGGTVLLKDLYTGTTGASPSYFNNALGKVIFTALGNGVIKPFLYITDGTALGTINLCQLSPNYPPSALGGVYPSLTSGKEIAGMFFFVAETATEGAELWVTDGTVSGTNMLKDINPGSASSSPRGFEVLNNFVYFLADDGVNGKELWKSDGTTLGTVLVKDIKIGASSTNITELKSYNGSLYFGATDGAASNEGLWKSDGTTAGTQKLSTSNLKSINQFSLFNNKLYFTASEAIVETELFETDGTAAGTLLTSDIDPGAVNAGTPGNKLDVNGKLYFSARNVSTTGHELWSYSPISNTTNLVKDVNAGVDNAITTSINALGLSNIVGVNNKIVFVANDSIAFPLKRNIWISDGTTAGTNAVLYSGTTNNQAGQSALTVFNNEVYFFSNYTGDLYLYKLTIGTTGINDIKNQSAMISIYPNPTRNTLLIDSKLEISTYQITNTLGQLIKSDKFNNQPIDIGNLDSGIYFISITTSDDKTFSRKILKE